VGDALGNEGEDGQWHNVACGSQPLTNAERKWSTTEKGCFAVVHFMNDWQHFLLQAKFKVVADHQALSWMFGQVEPPTGKTQLDIKYWLVQVNNNNNSDTHSRQPIANRDESGCQVKTTRQLALLDHMLIDGDGKLTQWKNMREAVMIIQL